MKKIWRLLLVFLFIIIIPNKEAFALSYTSYLDYPVSNPIVGDNLYVQGWVMSDDMQASLSVFINNERVDCDIIRYERADVIKSITGYGGILRNPTPGFKTTISLDRLKLDDGVHELKVQVLASSGSVVKNMTSKFQIKNNLAKMYLDYPTSNVVFGDTILLDGWVMSTNQNTKFRVLVDEVEFPITVARNIREDVQKAIKGYGDEIINPTPGFSIMADASSIDDGNHNLKIEYINSNGEILANCTKNIEIKKDVAKMYLDLPSANVNTTLVEVSGWVMSTNKNIELELYIDDKLVDTEFNRSDRLDVKDAIKGYGDVKINELPGFSTKVDLSDYLNGVHTVKVVTKNSNGTIISQIQKNIFLQKYQSNMCIDKPTYNYSVQGTSLEVSGWSMTNVSDTKIKVFVDDMEAVEILDRVPREDVLEAYFGKYNLSTNQLPGFRIDLDMSKYSDGKHTIFVRVYDKNTNELIDERNNIINLKKYQSNMYIDTPVSNLQMEGVELEINGWFMTEALDYSLKLFVDDKEIQTTFERLERIDVINAYIQKYDKEKNKLPGFITKVNLDSFIDGNHEFCVKAIDNITGEVLIQKSIRINLKKYQSKMYIDSPIYNKTINGIEMNTTGWVMTTSPEYYFKFYIDDTEVNISVERIVRDDVLNRYGSDYGIGEQNKLPGYSTVIDLANFKDGNHILKVKIYNSKTSELLVSREEKFYLKKYDGMLTIDYPGKVNYSSNSNLTIQGWELSESENSVVKVFFDNTEVSVVRYVREDVFAVYPNLYGGSAKTELPGFTTTMSLNSVSSGEHQISIQLYSAYGDLITSSSRKIIVYDKMYFGIDVSSHQGKINWEDVAKSGIDFAIIRLGVGDNIERQDDIEFINNVNGCVQNGIPYGVYLYSYATNLNGVSGVNQDSASIDSEIAHTLRVLGKLNSEQKEMLKLPVFIDMEDSSTISVGKVGLTNMADYYCANIQKNGYQCGIYANKNWLNNYLDSNYLGNKYNIWLAHYTDDYNYLSDYAGAYQLWQYTSCGTLSGITSSGLDMNVAFKKYW